MLLAYRKTSDQIKDQPIDSLLKLSEIIDFMIRNQVDDTFEGFLLYKPIELYSISNCSNKPQFRYEETSVYLSFGSVKVLKAMLYITKCEGYLSKDSLSF